MDVEKDRLRAVLEQAVMADPVTGLLGRRTVLPVEDVLRPRRAVVRGDLLVCAGAGEPVRAAGALGAFVSIHTPEDIARFARRYGPLRLCEHRLPCTHSEACDAAYWTQHHPVQVYEPPDADAFWAHFTRREEPTVEDVEPLGPWVAFVAQARAALETAARLAQGQPLPDHLWQPLVHGLYTDGPGMVAAAGRGGHRRRLAQVLVHQVVNHWLALGRVSPVLLDGSIRWWSLAATQSVFPALAVQLLTTVAGGHTLAVCDGCGRPFAADRKPQAGRRAFCPDCQESPLPARLRKRDQLRRQRQQGQQKQKEGSDEQ